MDDSTPSRCGEHYIVLSTGVIWDTGQFVAVPTPAGYDVEAFVVADDLGLGSWPLTAGDRVGFDLGHDVPVPPGEVSTSGNRDSQYFLRVDQDSTPIFPFLNESAFCTATLR